MEITRSVIIFCLGALHSLRYCECHDVMHNHINVIELVELSADAQISQHCWCWLQLQVLRDHHQAGHEGEPV